MFRRRPPRRPLRAPHARTRPGRRAPRELILANQMMESGDFAGAAAQFERMAQGAEVGGGGRPLPHFYLQAGRARLLAGHNKAGLAHLKRGLSLFVERGEWIHLHRAGDRIVVELRERGLSGEAQQISEFLKASLPSSFSAPQLDAPVRKPVLPTHCPACGGGIRPDEVDWLDEITAECAYCGSPVREEK